MLDKKVALILILSALLAGTYMGQAAGSSHPQPGSKEDPLVTRSYADKYLHEKYSPIEVKVHSMSVRIKDLEARVVEIKKAINPALKLTVNKKNAYIGEQLITLEAAPFMVSGRTMVPFRFIGEGLGAKVGWDPATRTVSYILGEKSLEIPIGSNTIKVNGKQETIEVAAQLVGGRTFVPVRVVSEHLGARVDWDAKTQTVTILP